MNSHQKNELDRYITGNWGENQLREDVDCLSCGWPALWDEACVECGYVNEYPNLPESEFDTLEEKEESKKYYDS